MHLYVGSGLFRAVLRVFFIVFLFLIAFLGDRCCRLRVKLKLLRGETVNMTAMTGWLKGFQPVKVMLHLRRFPAGWLGALMILCAVLAIVSDLAVSGLVHSYGLPSRCFFTEGVVLEKPYGYYPTYNGMAYIRASNAQYTSRLNGGYMGIYAKADDSTTFSADDDDFLGQWACSENGQNTSYNAADFPMYHDIMVDLVSRGLIYAEAEDPAGDMTSGSMYEAFGFGQLVLLSGSGPGTSWDIRAAVDTWDDLENGVQWIQAYKCSLQAVEGESPFISDILSTVNTTVTFNSWVNLIHGYMYNGLDMTYSISSEDIIDNLEWILNSLVMVAGSASSDTRGAPTDSFTDMTQGCIVEGVNLPPPIIALVFVVASIFVFMFVYTIALWFAVRRARKRHDSNEMQNGPSSKEILKHTPNGLIEWMKHAVHESALGEGVEQHPRGHHLKKWLFSSHYYGRNMSLVPKGNIVTSAAGMVPHGTPRETGFNADTPVHSPTGYESKAAISPVQVNETV